MKDTVPNILSSNGDRLLWLLCWSPVTQSMPLVTILLNAIKLFRIWVRLCSIFGSCLPLFWLVWNLNNTKELKLEFTNTSCDVKHVCIFIMTCQKHLIVKNKQKLCRLKQKGTTHYNNSQLGSYIWCLRPLPVIERHTIVLVITIFDPPGLHTVCNYR